MEKLRLAWKHNAGDGELTYDWYLWVNGKPTNHLISQWSGIYSYYEDGVEIGMTDTLKDAKSLLLKEIGLC